VVGGGGGGGGVHALVSHAFFAFFGHVKNT